MIVARTAGYASAPKVWDVCIVQGLFSVGPCQTLIVRFASISLITRHTQADAVVAHERLLSVEALMQQLEMDRGRILAHAATLEVYRRWPSPVCVCGSEGSTGRCPRALPPPLHRPRAPRDLVGPPTLIFAGQGGGA